MTCSSPSNGPPRSTALGLPLALLLGVLLASSSSRGEEVKKEHGFDALGVPLVGFNSDQGFGFGAVGGAYIYAPGYRPYRHGLALQVYFSSLGIQNHWIRYDGPRLIGGLRVEARAEFRRELYSPYYGPGNLSAPEFNGDTRDRNYLFDKTSPLGWVRIRGKPWGEDNPISLYLGYGYRYTTVRPYEGSLLAVQHPSGIEGGPSGAVQMGAFRDTRDDEGDPTSGGVEEFSVRLSGAPTASRYTFVGWTLSERRFFPLWNNRWILGLRATLDLQQGDVPFFEWSTIGGMTGGEGIGGMSSVRGLYRNRYVGTTKALGTLELRYYPFDFPFFGQPLKVGTLVFVDTGRAWYPETADGSWATWHSGAGVGLRFARRAAVVRIDYAVALENWRQGFYITFGHSF